jgi:ATP-dependent helicase HrpB
VVRKRGLEILPWTPALRQWRWRVMLLRRLESDAPEQRWPDLGDEAMLGSLEQWLLPFLDGVRRLDDFRQLDLKAILYARLSWPLPLDLERLAPERLAVPSGSVVAIDYSQDPPVLAVKLQEMFGCQETPTVADGRVPLQVHLLSPAGRPLQITRDLKGFWHNSYPEVKREMKGRYPKHPWPEDPLAAAPTRHTKRRAASE